MESPMRRTRTPARRGSPANRRLAWILAALVAAAASTGLAAAAPGNVQVDFDEDGMGFTATSDKDISNVIVLLCDDSQHKHDDLDGKVFEHMESELIVGVWVKSGNNQDPNGPPGAGKFFDNPYVDGQCVLIPYFPTAWAMALGAVGVLGAAAMVARRRR